MTWSARPVWAAVVPPPGPVRTLAAVNLTRTLGSGLLLSSTTIYFVRIVGLTPVQVGLGLSIAGLVALGISLPAGKLADRVGPRSITVAFTVLYGMAVSAYAWVVGFASYVITVSIARGLLVAAGVGASALVGRIIPAEQRVRSRAYMRVVSNIGVTVGVALGGVGLQVDSRGVYQVMFVVAGVGLLASALLYLRLEPVAPLPAPAAGSRLRVVRDGTYVLVTLLCAVLISYDTLMVVALPLWINAATPVPIAIYSALILVNTIMVVALQVRVSRSATSVPSSARTLRRAGVVLALCCVLFGLAGAGPVGGGLVVVSVVLLVAGAMALTLGELLYSAGSWGLSYDLAPEHAHGEYQGFFATGLQLSGVVAPLLVGAVLISGGFWGWLGAGVVLLLAGLAVTPVVARAQRRQVVGAPEPSAAAT